MFILQGKSTLGQFDMSCSNYNFTIIGGIHVYGAFIFNDKLPLLVYLLNLLYQVYPLEGKFPFADTHQSYCYCNVDRLLIIILITAEFSTIFVQNNF